MDLRILRYFLAVAEEGNITRASERLHVSQPALSTQLAALEDELGQKLFERGARGIELTEKGIALSTSRLPRAWFVVDHIVPISFRATKSRRYRSGGTGPRKLS